MWKYSMEVHGGDATRILYAFVTSPDVLKLKPQHILLQVKDCLIALQESQGESLSHLKRGSYP